MYCQSALLFMKIIVELDRNKNFESARIGFQLSNRFWISEKVSDSDHIPRCFKLFLLYNRERLQFNNVEPG